VQQVLQHVEHVQVGNTNQMLAPLHVKTVKQVNIPIPVTLFAQVVQEQLFPTLLVQGEVVGVRHVLLTKMQMLLVVNVLLIVNQVRILMVSIMDIVHTVQQADIRPPFKPQASI
jgi:hypothetical protein